MRKSFAALGVFALLLAALFVLGSGSASATGAPATPHITVTGDKTLTATVTVGFPDDESVDDTTKMCALDGVPKLYTGPMKIDALGEHTVSCRVKNLDGAVSLVATVDFELCQPPHPKPVVLVKLWVHDCTADDVATATLKLFVIGREKTVGYSATGKDGEVHAEGELTAGGKNPLAIEYLTLNEDVGGGEVTVTFGKREHVVKTDCAGDETTTPPTSSTTVTTTAPPSSASSTVPPASSSTPAPQGVVPVGNASGPSGGPTDLAYTGASLLAPIGIGVLLLLVGGLLILVNKRRARED